MNGQARIEYQPALDGVRALAVAAVLLFHAATPGFSGGYLGVSVFFTLSGYLITSLLLEEHAATGTIDLGAFYGRRIRRLLPASLFTVALIVVVSLTTDLFDGVAALRDHVLGSVFQVANWVFLAGEGSYQNLLADTSGTPSPLEHFWSLAVEEQFYWVWPVAMLAILRLATTWRARTCSIGGLTLAAGVAAPVIAAVWGPDAAYWATPARLSEILVGALLAVVLARRTLPARTAVLAPIGLVALGLCVVLFPASSGPAYEGALPLIGALSGVLLVGLQVEGTVRAALSAAPLVWLGKISYGVYLFHWPIYVLVDDDRLGTGGAVLTLVRLALTLGVSVLSYRLIEQPIRRARRIGLRPTLGTAALATAGVATLAAIAVPAATGDYWKVDDAVVQAAAIEVDEAPLTGLALSTTTTTATTTVPAALDTPGTTAAPPDATAATTDAPTTTAEPALPVLSRPVRIVLTGDSTAEALGAGLIAWAAANPTIAQAEVDAAPGCGFVRGGERRRGDGVESDAECDDWVAEQLIPAVQRAQPDVVAVMVTTWDLIGHRWSGDELLSPLDAEFRQRLDDAYAGLVDRLRFVGVPRIVLLRQPVPDVWWIPAVQEEDQPERHQVLYDTYAALESTHAGVVDVLGLDRWFSDQGFDRDHTVRPDGVHLDPAFAQQVVTDYLGERLIRAALGMDVS
jgi:peptidoglycan/LPS O-acetylase OafA/YrhL